MACDSNFSPLLTSVNLIQFHPSSSSLSFLIALLNCYLSQLIKFVATLYLIKMNQMNRGKFEWTDLLWKGWELDMAYWFWLVFFHLILKYTAVRLLQPIQKTYADTTSRGALTSSKVAVATTKHPSLFAIIKEMRILPIVGRSWLLLHQPCL